MQSFVRYLVGKGDDIVETTLKKIIYALGIACIILLLILVGCIGMYYLTSNPSAKQQDITTQESTTRDKDKETRDKDTSAKKNETKSNNEKKNSIIVPQPSPKLSAEEKEKKILSMAEDMEISYDEMREVTFYHYPLPKNYGINILPYIVRSPNSNVAGLRTYLRHMGYDWLFFTDVYVKTNERVHHLKFNKRDCEQDISSNRYETVVYETYDVPSDNAVIEAFRDIANSSVVKIRFVGKYKEERELTEEEIAKIKSTIELYDFITKG